MYSEPTGGRSNSSSAVQWTARRDSNRNSRLKSSTGVLSMTVHDLSIRREIVFFFWARCILLVPSSWTVNANLNWMRCHPISRNFRTGTALIWEKVRCSTSIPHRCLPLPSEEFPTLDLEIFVLEPLQSDHSRVRFVPEKFRIHRGRTKLLGFRSIAVGSLV